MDAVVFAYLFGSAARGEQDASSDVDVAVFVADEADRVEARVSVITAVARHLGTDQVDVVVLNSSPTAIVGRVLLDRVVVLDRQPFRRHAFESRALREFHDFRRMEK